MRGGPLAEQFDRLSEVYDATRSPPEDALADAVVNGLRSRGIASVLEIGVGTGRIALPLRARGLGVVGVDASAHMLARARAKGLPDLVRGDAYRLPFRAAAVDATLFVHVLHLLEDPVTALREACRVGRTGAVALVRPSPGEGPDPTADSAPGPDRLVAEILTEQGHPTRAAGAGPRRGEARLLALAPPDHLDVLSDRLVTERLSERLDFIGRGASRRFLDVPPEALARAVAEARARLGDREVSFRSIEALATWSRPP